MLRLTLIAFALTLGCSSAESTHQVSAAAPIGLQAQERAADVTSPEAHLGRPVGTDFQLADWEQVSSYYKRLAEESPRVETMRIGTSTEGREFLLSIISSEDNLARLDELKRYAAIIADPRGHTEAEKEEAIANGKVILLISPQMHSTETAGTEFAMEFAHRLATRDDEPWKSAREKIVIGIFACTNPDGLDHVVHWYRETVGKPYEATGLLKLYQYYTGHDNNRDWFMLTQNESRIVTEQLYSVWHPQIYWDVHQQGSGRERLFVPPYRDPLNPNLDPAIITGIDAIGSRALLDLTRDGFSGISTGVSYDMWWTGGNRNVPVRHNIIGILTEAASVNIASPIFFSKNDLSPPRGLDHYAPSNLFPNPWPGGWWRLRDIIEYELSFGRSLLGTIAREPALWMRNRLEATERAIARGRDESPRAWIIPSFNADPGAVHRLMDSLFLTGVEAHVADQPFIADGRDYPAGSIVIRSDQPYNNYIKDLFEAQRYPDGAPPYDVAGWSLPVLMGIDRVEVVHPLNENLALRLVTTADEAIAGFDGRMRELSPTSRDSRVWREAFEALSRGEMVVLDRSGGLRTKEIPSNERDEIDAPGPDTDQTLTTERMPRIGVYSPWSGDMDEGWLRWVLDTWKVPFTTVRNEHLRAGNLDQAFDLIIFPSTWSRMLDDGRTADTVPTEYAGGLAPEGAIAIEEFVRGGGRVIAMDDSAMWAIDLLKLPIVDALRDEGNREFSCPGSVLRAVAESDLLTAGLDDSISVFFSGSRAFRMMTDKERAEHGIAGDTKTVRTLVTFAPTRVLISGWIRKPEAVQGQAAWMRATYGAGSVDLFSFRPQYRGWSQEAFQLLFRAIVFGSDHTR